VLPVLLFISNRGMASQGLNKSMGISTVAPYSMIGLGKISEIYSHVIPFTGYARVQRDI
jgi:hypothetical protein